MEPLYPIDIKDDKEFTVVLHAGKFTQTIKKRKTYSRLIPNDFMHYRCRFCEWEYDMPQVNTEQMKVIFAHEHEHLNEVKEDDSN